MQGLQCISASHLAPPCRHPIPGKSSFTGWLTNTDYDEANHFLSHMEGKKVKAAGEEKKRGCHRNTQAL
jgi:hypothetical protein